MSSEGDPRQEHLQDSEVAISALSGAYVIAYQYYESAHFERALELFTAAGETLNRLIYSIGHTNEILQGIDDALVRRVGIDLQAMRCIHAIIGHQIATTRTLQKEEEERLAASQAFLSLWEGPQATNFLRSSAALYEMLAERALAHGKINKSESLRLRRNNLTWLAQTLASKSEQ